MVCSSGESYIRRYFYGLDDLRGLLVSVYDLDDYAFENKASEKYIHESKLTKSKERIRSEFKSKRHYSSVITYRHRLI